MNNDMDEATCWIVEQQKKPVVVGGCGFCDMNYKPELTCLPFTIIWHLMLPKPDHACSPFIFHALRGQQLYIYVSASLFICLFILFLGSIINCLSGASAKMQILFLASSINSLIGTRLVVHLHGVVFSTRTYH